MELILCEEGSAVRPKTEKKEGYTTGTMQQPHTAALKTLFCRD